MRIAVTGASGLIGWHIECALQAEGIDVVAVDRQAFADPHRLADAIRDTDIVVHAAGANRGDDVDVVATNIDLARGLATAVTTVPTPPHVIYLNSTHIDRDTAYGSSKREAARILASTNAPFLDLVLPGVFGEHGRPFYNSVVSTFCYQLAHGQSPSIENDAEMQLIHVQDVADLVMCSAAETLTGSHRPSGRTIRVTELAARLEALSCTYATGVVPSISDPFERAIFNTLRSYRFPHLYPTQLEPRSDERGRLIELVQAHTAGQMFISSTVPGVTRGNHFHRRKVERFIVVEGTATISLRRLLHNDVVTFTVSGQHPVAVDIPTLHTHNITNVGSDSLTTVFWTDEIFDPARPDTYAAIV